MDSEKGAEGRSRERAEAFKVSEGGPKACERRGHVRGAWFSTASSVNRPRDAAYAASMRTVALGRHEFGHMYRRMKSSALYRGPSQCGAGREGEKRTVRRAEKRAPRG